MIIADTFAQFLVQHLITVITKIYAKHIRFCILTREFFATALSSSSPILISWIVVNIEINSSLEVKPIWDTNLRNVPQSKRIDSFMRHDGKSIFFQILNSLDEEILDNINMFLLKSFLPLKPRPCMISFLLLRKPGMWKIPYNPIISLFNNLLTHQLILIRLQMINIHPIYNIDIPKLFELVQYMPKRVLIHLEQLLPCIVGCDCDESWGIVRLFVGEPFYYW